uniref:Uncharacterized protein n=1 Tax=Hyaloperonospora arabidopsidis (strain Emoy2) TaxID=559515 RepID=M4BMX6_HYAAE
MADVGTEATARTPRDDATERKKALLVFRSNLQSASDDDDEDASDEEDDDVTLVHCRAGATQEGDRGVPVEDEEEEDDDEALNGRRTRTVTIGPRARRSRTCILRVDPSRPAR